MMKEGNGRDEFARVVWRVGDVMEAHPGLSADQARTFLEQNERAIQDRLVATGNEIIEDLVDAKVATGELPPRPDDDAADMAPSA